MAAVFCALALMSGIIGAGFASGREILCFFAAHGHASGAAAAAAVLMLCALFLRLPAQMERAGCSSLTSLCAVRFGAKFGFLSAALFFLLHLLTGAAMLAACAELAALILPIRHAYGVGMVFSLLLSVLLCVRGSNALAVPGAALCMLLPAFLLRLLALPAGEACFPPATAPGLPVRAFADGVIYGALSAAQLAGALALLLPLSRFARRRAVMLFSILFAAVLSLSIKVCTRHLNAVWEQPLPFVWLCRMLGKEGYFLAACCLYTAALSTLPAMLFGMTQQLPFAPGRSAALCALACLPPALLGFGHLVKRAYPVLGALCAGLLLLLCCPVSCLTQETDAR